MDQIDPYNVPELFRGVPRPKNNQQNTNKNIKITLPKMEKRIFLKSARTKTVDSHNSIDSIGSIDCIDSIDSIESEDSTDSIDSIDFIDSIDCIDAILVPHKRSPTFTPHTKGTTTTIPMGRARSARPIGTVVGAREARAPFVCGVNVGGTCVC